MAEKTIEKPAPAEPMIKRESATDRLAKTMTRAVLSQPTREEKVREWLFTSPPEARGELRAQTGAEKIQNTLREKYYGAVGNRYYAEKSGEIARLGVEAGAAFAGGGVAGGVLGAIAKIGPKARVISHAAGGALTGVSTYTAAKESARAIREGRPEDALKIGAMFLIAGAGAAKGWHRGEMLTTRTREYITARARVKRASPAGLRNLNPAVKHRARVEYVLESVMPRRAAHSLGKFAREERAELRLVLLEKKPPEAKSDVLDLTKYDFLFKQRLPRVRESEPLTFERPRRQIFPERITEKVRAPPRPGRVPVAVPVRAPGRKQRERIPTLSMQPGRRIQNWILGERSKQVSTTREKRLTLNLNIPGERSKARVEQALGISSRTPAVSGEIKRTIPRIFTPPKPPALRKPPRVRLPGFRSKEKKREGIINLNVGQRYAEEFIHPFFGVRVRGKRKRRRR